MAISACQTATPPEMRVVLDRDGRSTETTFEPAQPRRSDVTREAAIATALVHLKVTDLTVTANDARFVVLVLRTPDDGAMVVTRRRAWWVVVSDEKFPVTACMCDGTPYNLGSAVVVDAESGLALTSVGIAREAN